MAKRSDSRPATEALEEIESIFDRIARWVAENPRQVLGLMGAILLLAAAVSGWNTWQERRETRASAALARVQAAFLAAMGATPGSFEVVEIANPEIAQRVRDEYVEQFIEVADQHAGTTSAVSARLEAATLQEKSGDLDAALASLRTAAEQARQASPLAGVVWVRIGEALESESRWTEAGAAYAQAGAIEDMPTHIEALADAARCFAVAGDVKRALEIFERIEREAPDAPLAPHIRARLRELRFAERARAE